MKTKDDNHLNEYFDPSDRYEFFTPPLLDLIGYKKISKSEFENNYPFGFDDLDILR